MLKSFAFIFLTTIVGTSLFDWRCVTSFISTVEKQIKNLHSSCLWELRHYWWIDDVIYIFTIFVTCHCLISKMNIQIIFCVDIMALYILQGKYWLSYFWQIISKQVWCHLVIISSIQKFICKLNLDLVLSRWQHKPKRNRVYPMQIFEICCRN